MQRRKILVTALMFFVFVFKYRDEWKQCKLSAPPKLFSGIETKDFLSSQGKKHPFLVMKQNCLRVTAWQGCFVKECRTISHKKYCSHCAFHLCQLCMLDSIPQMFPC